MIKKEPPATFATHLLECINSGREVGGFWHTEVIRAARKAKGLTLQQLAKKVGCTQGFLSRFENGNKSPSPYLLEKILQVLDLGMDLGEELVPLGASKRTIDRIEKQRQTREVRLQESRILGRVARVRILSAVVLTALRDKGYQAEAKLPDPGDPHSLKIVVGGDGEYEFTVSIKEN